VIDTTQLGAALRRARCAVPEGLTVTFDLRPCGLEVGELVALEAHVEEAPIEDEFVLAQSNVRDIGPSHERAGVRSSLDETGIVDVDCR